MPSKKSITHSAIKPYKLYTATPGVMLVGISTSDKLPITVKDPEDGSIWTLSRNPEDDWLRGEWADETLAAYLPGGVENSETLVVESTRPAPGTRLDDEVIVLGGPVYARLRVKGKSMFYEYRDSSGAFVSKNWPISNILKFLSNA